MASFKKVPTLSAESNYAQFGSWKIDLGAYLSRNDMQLWSTLDEDKMPDGYPAEVDEDETIVDADPPSKAPGSDEFQDGPFTLIDYPVPAEDESDDEETWVFGFEFVDSNPHKPKDAAVRIWCADIDVLRKCLLWYTTSKFTPSNQSFIDSTPWDDANCEFDPRVFQAYVWRTAPAE